MLEGLGLKITKVPSMKATETTLESVKSKLSRRDNRVQGTLILRGALHLEEVDLIP